MIGWNVPVTITRLADAVANVKLPKLSGMIKNLPLILIAATLVGCYVPNDRLWDSRVREKVTVGMPLDRALAQLHEMTIACESTMPSASGTLRCSRVRQRLWPSSCIERVNLRIAPDTRKLEAIDIPPIVCAGL